MSQTDRYSKFRVANFPQTGLSGYLPVDGIEVKFLDGCNRSCSFCVNEDYAGKPSNLLDAQRFVASVLAWFDDATEPERPQAIYGTGGEPLMALDVVDAVFRPLAGRGLVSRLVTNGTLLTAPRVERLVDMGLAGIKVTYNSTRDDRLKALMGNAKPGDARRILDGIRRAREAGLWVFVRIGMGRHNVDEVADIYKLLRDVGVDVVQIKPWIPSGLAAVNRDTLSLSPRELEDTFVGLAKQIDLSGTDGPEVTVSCFPPARKHGFSVKDCANVAKLYCEPCGRVRICNFASEYLGSWLPEHGGLAACVRRRRELYGRVMDDHGVASCPARHNWTEPVAVASPEREPGSRLRLPIFEQPSPVACASKG